MQYHHNAKTNIAQRQAIKEAGSTPNRVLAKQYCVSHTTVGKWKNSDQVEDHSSRPLTIHYALTKAEERIITKVRDQGFLLDELLEALSPYIERLNRSNCYRTLLRYKCKRNKFGKIEKKNLFEAICSIAGIEHRKTKVKHPWTNGLAERMVRTAKENTIKVTHYQNISEAIQDFKRFQNYHNYRRKLKMLQNRTPYETLIEWYEKKPELFIYHPANMINFWKERGET